MSPVSKSLDGAQDSGRTRTANLLSDELERFASRFAAPARREIRRLMRSSPRLADLSIVFPAAIYALAQRRGSASERHAALSLVEEGAPLRAVARALDLPLWLRRLPPESFREPIPALPGSEVFTRRIAARLPTAPRNSAFWLESVGFAVNACHEEFALWLAEQRLFDEPGNPERLFPVLAAYAWFSGAIATRAHRLIVVPWRPEIAFDTALCAAKSWFNRIRLVLQLRDGVITDTWLLGGQVNGFTIQPITTNETILAEAHAMQNCADQYAERLSLDKCRLFSIRRNGTRIATMEIGPHQREPGMLAITQLKARHNMAAPVDVWQAAHAWMAMQNGLKRLPSLAPPERPLDDDTWQALMAPYRHARNGAPWLAPSATLTAFADLDADLAELARRGGVSSWLFT
jgi:hypothetical protein